MPLQVYAQPAEFMAAVQASLERDEVANNLMLGTGLRLLEDANAYGTPPFLAAVRGAGTVTLAAIMTPPHALQVCELAEGSHGVIPEVARELHGRELPVSGVLATEPVARAFAEVWCALTGHIHRIANRLRAHQLTVLSHPVYSPGSLRVASEGDTPLVTDWMRAFQQEADLFRPLDEAAIVKRAHAAVNESRAYFWEDGKPVSMALRVRATRHAECIGGVYTPPEFRKHGYASSCVARLSQLILDSGKRFSCLYTDLANPTSNKIYAAMGYVPVRDLVTLAFEKQ